MFGGRANQPSLSDLRAGVELKLGSLTISADPSKVTDAELEHLENSYLAKVGTPIMPTRDFKGFLRSRAKQGFFVATTRHNGIAVACIVANITKLEAYKGRMFSMEFFDTTLNGLLAAKAVILSHRAIIVRGKQLAADYATSSCFYRDTKHDLNRILETDGWKSEGYMSVFDLRK